MNPMTHGPADPAKPSDLAVRAVAGALMVALALAAVWWGGFPFWLLIMLAALVMLLEWSGLVAAPRRSTGVAVFMLLVLLGLGGLAAGSLFQWLGGYAVLTAGDAELPVSGMHRLLFSLDAHALRLVPMLICAGALLTTLLTFHSRLGVGVIYAGLPAFALLYLRYTPTNGVALILWTFAVVWATDTGAYFAGRAIGGPKLAPRISPNKTWAGLIGGVLAATVAGALIAAVFRLPALLLVLGGAMAVLAQIGDLFESWMKREAGVKDSGDLLPGHGGVLDRLDGLVPVAAAMLVLVAVLP